jgi:hypothetical protein
MSSCGCRCWFLSSCLEHIVNLSNVNIMAHIMKLAVIETMNTIWDYDPSEPDNCVLGGSLDIIATIQTLAIKVCGHSGISLPH